jgi:ParB-like chromosome segregation protein Spo0J
MTAKRVEVPVDSIVVDDQFGRYHDDSHTEMRAEIVAGYGMLYPITVDKDLRLLAGDQWLMAVKKLGLKTVEVLIVDTDS